MELDSERKELLLKTLMELGEDDFKAFKFFTDLPQRVLGTHSPVDIAYELVKKHGEKTLEETIKILEKIGNKNLAEMLRRNMLEIRGAVFSVHDDNQIARLKADLQGNLQSLYSFVPEGNTERWQQQPLADVYTELDVTYGADVRPNERHEVLQMETRGTAAKESILPCDIFKSHDGKERPIRTLLTVGFAGIGKTFLVQKFVCDWASGNTNQDVHFIFPFTFRELNMDEGKSFTLAELIRRYVCESRHMSEETLNEILANLQTSGKRDYESSGIKILFVLDGLDECKFKMDLKNQMKVDVDVKKAYPLEVLLAHLIKRNLLPCARVWITTRPATARDIPSDLIDSRTEVRGFSDYQRLAYFRKKFPNEERVIEHIRKTRTIFIMCHLPIFCWLTATVLQDHLDKGKEVELPTTLTDMYSEYILNQLENSKERLKTEYISDVKALAKLAFHHTMSNRQIFYEKDLADSGFDYSQAAKHCGIFTQVFKEVRPLRRNQQGKMFQFIHLTIQEYLAAFYVIMSLFHDDKNVLADSELGMEGAFQEEDKPEELEETESEDEESEEEETEDEGDWKITEVHQSALQKASESKGNLDLFLRFLIGLSLPCNQELVGEMLKAPKDSRQSKSKTVKLIKEQIKRNTPENNINLFYCLNELKDDSLLKQFQKKKGSKKHLKWHKMPNAMWSALVFFLLTDDKTMRSFDLSKYASSPLGLEKLLVAVKASQESVLSQCQITEKGCISLAEALKLNPSHLQELDLSHNNLSDEGVEIISKGLASPNCILQILGLKHCKITKRGCVYLAEALTLNPSHLQELHLCGNDLSDKGVEILSKEVASPHGILKVLKASWCRITKNGCVFLAEALKLNFYLRELHLEGNNLSDEGVEILSKELATTHCILKVLKLEHCKITKRGCVFLAEVLQINPSHLQELDLSCNDLSDEGVKILLKGLASPHCILQVLKLRKCGITKRTCVSLAEALKLNPSHLQELDLSSNDLSDEGVEILLKGLTSLHCILQVLKLDTCNLDKGSCHLLASVLSSPSNLRHLDLSCNDLSDEGVEILSKGLASPHCILQVFEMSWCKITNKGCVSLAKAYKSNPSHLQQLHIMCNPLGEKGKRLLIDIQEDPSYSLTTVKLDSCNLDKGSCHLLASVLSFPSKLRHLDLRHNNLSDEGVEILSKGLALKLNPSHLQELDLSSNNLSDEGVEILSKGLVSPHCILKVVHTDKEIRSSRFDESSRAANSSFTAEDSPRRKIPHSAASPKPHSAAKIPRVIKPTVFESLKGQREDRKDKTESLWTSLHNPHLGSLLVWYFWASIALVLKACSCAVFQ
nr:NACHT, LRR and PYD domains-containing protein 12-like [Nerophis lumbriciformis]